MKPLFPMLFAAFFALAFAACDDEPEVDPNAPLTNCEFSYQVTNPDGLHIGAMCEADADCMYGKCMLPGESGNLTNEVFGFCTRGCDCDNATDSQLTDEEKQDYLCLYPPGNQGGWHHVVGRCNVCDAMDPGWTDCGLPGSGATPVCLAE